ncbi:MAG TPA: hypothetical protein VNZ58_08750, partial [Thermomicrobiales bacterium]|nr:hypothetical protein [Thermomicrobiales bacterium]
PAPDIFRVVLRGMARHHRAWVPGLAQELTTGFIQADHRSPRIIRALVDGQHILHRGDTCRVGSRSQAPFVNAPRF